MLTIGISTVASYLPELLGKISDCPVFKSNDVDFLIVSQKESENKIVNLNEKIKIIYSTSIGLSKSRNLVIENCHKDWLWFQDDDIVLNEDSVFNLMLKLECCKDDIVLTKVGSLECPDKLYKSYKFHNNHSMLNMLKVSSIEIIVSVSFLKINAIKFNEDFGLGTSMPCCEENIFLLDCFHASGSFKYLDIVCCFHTTNLELRNISYEKNLFAKGKFLSMLPFYIATPLLLKWTFMKTDLKKGQQFRLLAKGLIEGKRLK